MVAWRKVEPAKKKKIKIQLHHYCHTHIDTCTHCENINHDSDVWKQSTCHSCQAVTMPSSSGGEILRLRYITSSHWTCQTGGFLTQVCTHKHIFLFPHTNYYYWHSFLQFAIVQLLVLIKSSDCQTHSLVSAFNLTRMTKPASKQRNNALNGPLSFWLEKSRSGGRT